MNNKYRVVSLCWVDVYASSMDDARKVAGDIYYNMTPEEQDGLPGLASVRPFGDDGFELDGEDMLGWFTWSPNNDPF